MDKKEARIARKLEKQLDQQEKSARLREAVLEAKAPRVLEGVYASSQPRVGADPTSFMQMKMEYRLKPSADRDGQWSWGEQRNWCSDVYHSGNNCELRSTLMFMSALQWNEIFAQTTNGHSKHHGQSWDTICAEAQERWVEIGRTEDQLFRFRCGGKQRIWGYRESHVFFVVWWDAEHQIYPVD